MLIYVLFFLTFVICNQMFDLIDKLFLFLTKRDVLSITSEEEATYYIMIRPKSVNSNLVIQLGSMTL